MDNRMVSIESMVNATVVIKKPEYGVNRRWLKRGQRQAIPFDTISQLLWDNGVKHMFDTGMLYISNMQDKIDLGLEPEDATEPQNIIALTIDDMKNYMTEKPIDEFKRDVLQLPRTQVDNLISYAVETQLIDGQKCAFLKKLTGKDILKTISRIQEMEEIDRQEEEKAKLAQKYNGR